MSSPELEKTGNHPAFYRKASISFIMRFAGLALQFLAAIAVARLLGAENYGAFTYASTWAVFIGSLIPLGLDRLSVRELPAYLTGSQFRLLSGYLLTVLATIAVTSLIAALVLFGLEQSGLLTLAPGWKLVAVFAIIHALVLSVSNGLNAFQRILTSQFLETILRQTIYLSLIGGTVILGYRLTPHGAFEMSLLSALPVLAIMVVILNRMRLASGAGGAKPRLRLRPWFAGGVALLVTVVADRLQQDLDVLMVGTLLGNFEVGVYRAAARGAVLVSIANMVALQLVGPMLSRALSAKDNAQAQHLLSQAATVSFLTGVPILLTFGLGSSLYLGLYGPEFVHASLSLKILMIGQASMVLAGADAVLLIMLHKEKLILLVTTAGVAMNFALNLALIGPYGIEGAAIASMISMIFVRLTLVTYILRTTEFNPTIFGVIRPWLGRKGR